ncbi:hypothetical protein LCGC14_1431990, partial [marine sediment metagenome]
MIRHTFCRLVLLALLVSMASAAWAQTTAPTATAPAAKVKIDHVKDLIDDYLQGRERELFFAAAGVDGELTKTEFATAGKKQKTFVRSYDRWEVAVVHDADKSVKLSWPEAEKYRLAVKKRVLRLFDKNKDGKLLGAERDQANAYLARGLRGMSGRLGSLMSRGGGMFGQGLTRQYDTNKDGKLDDSERAAMQEGLRKRAEQYRRNWELRRYDTNKDGKLDEKEIAARDKVQA